MYFSQTVAGLQFAGVIRGTEGAYAIMVRKGNDKLRTEINGALGDMENDGTRRRFLCRWFGDDQAEVSR
jgi:ABC-type amino acid transport substrate-binding protein